MRLIDKFMINKKPLKKSKLSEIDDEILELLGKKYPIKLIYEYITAYRKISVELKYLHRYIKKLKSAGSENTDIAITPIAKASTVPAAVVAKPTPTQAIAPVVANAQEAEQKQPKQRPPLGTKKMSEEDAENAFKPGTNQVKVYQPGDFEKKLFGELK